MHWLFLPAIIALMSISVMPFVSAERGDQCFEQMDGSFCGLLSAWEDPVTGDVVDTPFGAMLEAYDPIFGDLTIAILWGILIAVLWMKVQNTALVGIVGLVVAGSVVGLDPDAYRVGILLVVVSMGIILFQLVQQRIKYPQ